MSIDTTTFFAQLLTTTRQNLASGAPTVRQAAQHALNEAHSALSQEHFFAAYDYLGGAEAIITTLAEAIKAVEMPMQHQCIYCYAMLDGPEPDHAPPVVDDDASWETLSRAHADWCEWIATRAHRQSA